MIPGFQDDETSGNGASCLRRLPRTSVEIRAQRDGNLLPHSRTFIVLGIRTFIVLGIRTFIVLEIRMSPDVLPSGNSEGLRALEGQCAVLGDADREGSRDHAFEESLVDLVGGAARGENFRLHGAGAGLDLEKLGALGMNAARPEDESDRLARSDRTTRALHQRGN